MKMIQFALGVILLSPFAGVAQEPTSRLSMAAELPASAAEAQPGTYEQRYQHRIVAHEFEFEGHQVATPEPGTQNFPAVRLASEGHVLSSYRSLVVETAVPFRALVPSWNVETASSVLIDVRVRHAATGQWSPWLRLGRVGEGAPDEPEAVRVWEGGRVAVDLIEANVDLDAWQYRVSLARSGEAGLRRFVMVETAKAPEGSTQSRPDVPAMELSVPFRSQMTQKPEIAGRICSPTSVTMVVASHGLEHEVQAVADLAYDHDFDIYGNWPRNIQAGFKLGLEGYVSRINDWSEVSRHLSAGRPLVASIRVKPGELDAAPYPDTAGHLIVIRGFDGQGGVLVSDPAVETPELGELVYPMRDLETVWFTGSAGTTYVMLPGN